MRATNVKDVESLSHCAHFGNLGKNGLTEKPKRTILGRLTVHDVVIVDAIKEDDGQTDEQT